jgi:lysophospholipase L1-like esterase
MKLKSIILWASLLLNVGIISGFILRHQNFSRQQIAASNAPSETELWQRARIDVINSLPVDTASIVFMGTSLTNGFELDEMFGNVHVKNRGVGGATTAEILTFLDKIVKGKPKKIFLEGGINDLFKSKPVDTVVINFAAMIDKIKAVSPATKIYLTSMFPVGHQRDSVQGKIVVCNNELKKLCHTTGVMYMDMYNALTSTGVLSDSLTFDGIHLNGAGYEIWKNDIAFAVN